MSGKTKLAVKAWARRFLAALMAVAVLLPSAAIAPAAAATGERTLYLHYIHTGETARITFWRNGRFDRRGLAQLNEFLRDWRREESAEMDPNLFNLIWEVYQEVDATQPVHVVSAYRSPATNEMLRSRSSAVAKNSRHTQGMAMDFFIPGVPLSRLRAVAIKHQIGGVGYYPSSGSPFVHLDTGNVRAWPRMTRAQLEELFPDGKTLHLPTDGVPLSQTGRQYAAAEWQRCHRIPCSSLPSGGETGTTRLASSGEQRRPLLDRLLGGNDEPAVAAPVRPTPPPIAPPRRPDSAVVLADAESLPIPPIIPASLRAAAPVALSAEPAADPTLAVAALDVPNSPARGLRVTGADDALRAETFGADANALFAAYAPVEADSVGAQKALEILLERRGGEGASDPLATLEAAHVAAAGQSSSARRALDMLLDQRRSRNAIEAGVLNVQPTPIVTASFRPQADIGDLLRALGAGEPQALPAPLIAPEPAPAPDGQRLELTAPRLANLMGIFVDAAPFARTPGADFIRPPGAEIVPGADFDDLSGGAPGRFDTDARPRFGVSGPQPTLLVASR